MPHASCGWCTATEARRRRQAELEDDAGSDTSGDSVSDDDQEGEEDYRIGGYHRVRVRRYPLPSPTAEEER